jgi:cobalamin synthase
MRRAGPFYPLLVAAQLQTRLPIAASLEPSDEDIDRARPWLPAVGLIWGALLALFAGVLLASALATPIVAALVVTAMVVLGGAWSELGLARTTSRLLDRAGDIYGDVREQRVAPIAVSIAVLMLVRAAGLWSIEAGAWTGALIASQVAARFSMVVAARWNSRPSAVEGEESMSWMAFGISALAAVMIVAVAGGGAGLLALVLAVPPGLFAARLARDGDVDETTAGPAALAEMLAIICFAAVSPAAVLLM